MSRSLKVFGALLFGLVLGAGVGANAATTTTGKTRRHSAGTARVATTVKARSGASHAGSAHSGSTSRGTAHVIATHGVVRRHRGARPTLAVRRTRYQEHFSASSYADNLTLGDVVDGEDPLVRAAAIEALGNMNGTAIAIDPSTGRILAMVNQKLALSRGLNPARRSS
ncbi:hypothetical protein [Tunturiibacter empetritectus]|uniref:hypothetical protein n=1 Tax=Tunturiibacter empetritectus TaxID=3069691 RepID=UPI003D9BE53F